MGTLNHVLNGRGETIGYRCMRCYIFAESMWGNICNKCQNDDKKHKELCELEKLKKENEELKRKINAR